MNDGHEQIAPWLQTLARWNAFGTYTFELPTSVFGAQKNFERWTRRIMFGIPTFYAVEMHPGGHGAHIHAIHDLNKRRRSDVWNDWFNRYGRNCVLPIQELGGVVGYCSKYCVKQAYRNGWWNILFCTRCQHNKLELPVQRHVFPVDTRKDWKRDLTTAQ